MVGTARLSLAVYRYPIRANHTFYDYVACVLYGTDRSSKFMIEKSLYAPTHDDVGVYSYISNVT